MVNPSNTNNRWGHKMNRLISDYLARTETRLSRRTMSDAQLIGWSVLISLFVAPFVAVLSFIVFIPGLS
jgi:hypothetical protein